MSNSYMIKLPVKSRNALKLSAYVDIERLIFLVREHPEIYDPENIKHRDREHVNYVWHQISEELNVNYGEVKTKWQNLRSNYMREKRKIKNTPTNQIPRSTWRYYGQLNFLDRVVGTQEFQEFSLEEGDVVKEIKQEPPDECVHRGSSSEDNTLDETHQKHLIVSRENAEQVEENDPDLMFLKSLLPFMKSLKPFQNLEFRGEVISLLKNKLAVNQ